MDNNVKMTVEELNEYYTALYNYGKAAYDRGVRHATIGACFSIVVWAGIMYYIERTQSRRKNRK